MITPGDTWTFSTNDNPEIMFCVWVLRRDGLRVPPFDRHGDGDGALRAAGLTAENWSAWFAAVIAEVAGRDRGFRARAVEQVTAGLGARVMPPEPHRSALDRWPGPAALRRELTALDAVHRSERRERKARFHDEFQRRAGDAARAERSHQLWRDIQRHRPLPPLFFYLVDYPEPVSVVAPPDAAVLGGVGTVAGSGPTYDRLVLDAAAQLSGR